MTSDTSHYTNSVSSLPIATLLLFCLVLFLLFIKKFLFCKNRSTNIRLFYDDNQFNQEVISLIPQLTRNYTPPCWMRNRILATLIFGMFGRFGNRHTDPVRSRRRLELPDGTTISFDLYLDPPREDPILENVIIIIIPGVSNHSESDYIQGYIDYTQSQGIKSACLNHMGSACGERINPEVPRIHTYGGTGDLSAMVDYLRDKYPGKKFIGVGFSLGANILLKYLGERPERQAYFLGAQSWCQGYDVNICLPYMNRYLNGGRLFNVLITRKKKTEVRNLLGTLFADKPTDIRNPDLDIEACEMGKDRTPEDELRPLMEASIRTDKETTDDVIFPVVETQVSVDTAESKRELPSWVPRYAHQRIGREVGTDNPLRDVNGFLIEGWENVPPFDVEEFNRATGIASMDASFCRPYLGFQTQEDFYRWSGSLYVMDQITDFPVLLINAKDDPVIPYRIVENIMTNHSRINNKAIGLIPQHGGHLAFFEGYCCAKQRVSWVDKVSVLHARSLESIQSADYTDRI